MEFSEKFISTTINTEGKPIVISDDAYVIGLMLNEFIKELRWQAGKSRERQ